MKVKTWALALVAALSVTGCGNSEDVTFYEPGVYKGPADPLLEKERTKELQSALDERVQHQSDR
jgi:hypothetical protein